mmetsp:Transcript_71493/g.185647  ORF Transcript_71493/g.185647 Transcript_71493/m.185647 type:complete len:239 (-) Transcript_71493:372-1088(-)
MRWGGACSRLLRVPPRVLGIGRSFPRCGSITTAGVPGKSYLAQAELDAGLQPARDTIFWQRRPLLQERISEHRRQWLLGGMHHDDAGRGCARRAHSRYLSNLHDSARGRPGRRLRASSSGVPRHDHAFLRHGLPECVSLGLRAAAVQPRLVCQHHRRGQHIIIDLRKRFAHGSRRHLQRELLGCGPFPLGAGCRELRLRCLGGGLHTVRSRLSEGLFGHAGFRVPAPVRGHLVGEAAA